MNWERELDATDLRLLASISALGERSVNDFQEQLRLDRLEVEGYVRSRRLELHAPESPSAWTYSLTPKGRHAIRHPQP